MKHFMFSVFDVKAGAYLQPWFLPTEGMAKRCFADCVNDKEHNFGLHPADYTLFCVGMFDDSKADLFADGGPKSIGNGLEFLQGFAVEDNQEVRDDFHVVREN